MYEMLLGQSPFRGDDEDEIFDAILEDEPLYPITMPKDAVSILQKVREALGSIGSVFFLTGYSFPSRFDGIVSSCSLGTQIGDLGLGRVTRKKSNDTRSSRM